MKLLILSERICIKIKADLTAGFTFGIKQIIYCINLNFISINIKYKLGTDMKNDISQMPFATLLACHHCFGDFFYVMMQYFSNFTPDVLL